MKKINLSLGLCLLEFNFKQIVEGHMLQTRPKSASTSKSKFPSNEIA